jgi:hypothetical protein
MLVARQLPRSSRTTRVPILGCVGAGWNEEESGAYAIGLGGQADRSDRFEEACQVIVSRPYGRARERAI